MTKIFALTLISLVSFTAFALDEGTYRLSQNRFGICPRQINILINTAVGGSNSILAGSWAFTHVNEGPMIFEGPGYRSTTTSSARESVYTKTRVNYDRATGRTTTQITQLFVNRDVVHIIDRDAAIPSTTVDCTYVFIRN